MPQGDTAEIQREKEWILGFEFQKLKLEMTPRAGEKIRETERERFVGRGAWGWPWGDHMDVKGVQPPLLRELSAADTMELSRAELTLADGLLSMNPMWLRWCSMRSSHGQQQEHCPLTSQLVGCRSCPWGQSLLTFHSRTLKPPNIGWS